MQTHDKKHHQKIVPNPVTEKEKVNIQPQSLPDKSSQNNSNSLQVIGAKKWKKALSILALLGLVAFCFFFFSKEEKPTLDNFPIQEKKAESSSQKLIAPTALAEEGKTSRPKKQRVPKRKTIKIPSFAPAAQQKKNTSPTTASFQPNPNLENLIGSDTKGSNFDFQISIPTNIAFKSNIQAKGNLTTKENLNDHAFRWLLFSNKTSDYKSFKPLISQALVFLEKNQTFAFEINEKNNFPKGLYYYLIEDENSKEVFAVGKLFIK